MKRATRLVLACVLAVAGCSQPLPEAGTPAAETYAAACNRCHRVYQPRLMTEKMWETMVARMETEMARNGMALAPQDKAVILDYLKRNAARP